MNTALKSTGKATYNYTGRGSIKQKLCHISVVERDDDQMLAKLHLDLDNLHLEHGQKLVLEALYRGVYFRKKIHNPKTVHDIYINGFPEKSNPSFRLKVLSSDNEMTGKIISATKFFKAKFEENEKEIRKNILKFRLTNDIGDQIWQIDWSDPQYPVILLKKDFSEKYYHHDLKTLSFILPPILKELLTGLFLRFDSQDKIDERSDAGRWLKFFETKLPGWSLPDDEDWDNDDKTHLLELADNAIRIFCDQKWIEGKKTFLQYLIEKNWS